MLRSSLKLSLLNNQILIWCFSFVTLFNLQGTHRSRRRVFILPHLVRFVKNFFRVFSNSFVLSSAAFTVAGAVLADSLIRLPHFRAFVKHFFQPGSNFFSSASRPPQRGSLCSPAGAVPFRRALAYISKHFLPCQHLFLTFFPFFYPAPPLHHIFHLTPFPYHYIWTASSLSIC